MISKYFKVKNMLKGERENRKGLMKQQVMDPPAMGTELQVICIAHPTLGTDQTGSKMLLKAMRHHGILVGGLLFTSLT